MKPGLKALLYIFIFLLHSKVASQSEYYRFKDSLDYFLQKEDFHTYFKTVDKMTVIAADALADPSKLDSTGQCLMLDFEGLSMEQKADLRYSAMIVGYKFQNKFGNFGKALQYYFLAHQYVRDKEKLDKYSWYIENEIYTIYTRKGDYEKAEYFGNLVEKSFRHLIQTESNAIGFVKNFSRFYTNRGIQQQSEGKGTESFQSFSKGYSIADSIQYPVGICSNGMGLAEYYLDSNEYQLAEHYLIIVDSILPQLYSEKNYKERKADLLFHQAELLARKGRTLDDQNVLKQSIPLYQMAIDTLGQYFKSRKRREFAKYYAPLASVYIEMDSLDLAERAIQKGLSSIIADYNTFDHLPLASQLYHENSFTELFKLQSTLFQRKYAQTNDSKFLEAALKSVDLGLVANDIIRNEVIADPSKLITIRDNKILTHDGIQISWILYTMHHQKEYLIKARELFNRSKSLLLEEKIKKHRLMDQLSFEDSTSLAQYQSGILSLHMAKFSENIDLDSLNGLILLRQEEMEKIFDRYTENQEPVERNEDYIEYSVHDNDVFVLASVNGVQQFIKLGLGSELKKLLLRMNDHILLRSMSDDSTIQRDMFEYMMAPILTNIPEQLLIITDGETGYIPFDMLKDRDDKLLIERSNISYAYEYEYYQKPAMDKRKYDIFCLVPSYDQKVIQEDEATRGSLYELPYAKMEADSIQRIFGDAALISREINKDSLVTQLGQSSVFHFAGHAIVMKDEAYLSLSSDDEKKSQWTDQEISLLFHSPELVVLSACETGLGKLETGEGIRSLGRSFIESGASATIISLWNVNDQSTAKIMTSFYKYLKQGMRIDEALRQSKLDYLKSASPRFSHPYFWAAFIPSGDMDPIH